jgi:hypothetical protein
MLDWPHCFEQAFRWEDWLATVRVSRERWRDRYEDAFPDEHLLETHRVEDDARYVLCLVEDDCTDSIGSVPVIARACEDVGPDIELRVMRKSEHPDVMEHLMVDGKRSTPAIVIFGEDWQWLGRWGPRPAGARALAARIHGTVPENDFEEQLERWYDQDDGDQVLREFLPLLRGPGGHGTRVSLPVYEKREE